MISYTISPFLDERYEKKNGLYPLKIRVYYDYKTKLYPTDLNLSKLDFQQSWLSEKPRSDLKNLKLTITSLVSKVKDVADLLNTFSFEKFEKQLYRGLDDGKDIFYHYREKINILYNNEQIKSAKSYDSSAKSLKNFLKFKNKNCEELFFEDANSTFLNEYEQWMIKNGRSYSTVGIYLRPLRYIFNYAISSGDVPKEVYPFKNHMYSIPTASNTKKSLTRDELKILYTFSIGSDLSIKKARAFWFFSYQCNGINMKDICELKYRDVNENIITFFRSKTMRTSKANQKKIKVVITTYVREIIGEYGNKNVSPDTYVFPIFNGTMNAEEKVRACEAFTRFINQHMKKLAKLAGVTEKISTYFARHSYTTISIQNGASLEFVQESLGHASMKTTMNYWKGFEDNVKTDMANKLMEF